MRIKKVILSKIYDINRKILCGTIKKITFLRNEASNCLFVVNGISEFDLNGRFDHLIN